MHAYNKPRGHCIPCDIDCGPALRLRNVKARVCTGLQALLTGGVRNSYQFWLGATLSLQDCYTESQRSHWQEGRAGPVYKMLLRDAVHLGNEYLRILKIIQKETMNDGCQVDTYVATISMRSIVPYILVYKPGLLFSNGNFQTSRPGFYSRQALLQVYRLVLLSVLLYC